MRTAKDALQKPDRGTKVEEVKWNESCLSPSLSHAAALPTQRVRFSRISFVECIRSRCHRSQDSSHFWTCRKATHQQGPSLSSGEAQDVQDPDSHTHARTTTSDRNIESYRNCSRMRHTSSIQISIHPLRRIHAYCSHQQKQSSAQPNASKCLCYKLQYPYTRTSTNSKSVNGALFLLRLSADGISSSPPHLDRTSLSSLNALQPDHLRDSILLAWS